MPFNSAGVYTPASGATTATPGALIQSAVWNAINTDYTAALTLLGEQLYGSTSVVATPYVPAATDTLALINVAGAVTVNLPTAASRSGYPITIKDISGAAHTNNITINRNTSDTIDGATSIKITSDYGGYTLFPITGGWALRPSSVQAVGATSVLASSSILSNSPSAGVGYATGAGGVVTQASTRTTAVTVNTITGAITLVSAAGSATPASFTVNNSSVATTDVVKVVQKSGTDLYEIFVTNVGAGSFKITFFTTGGTTVEQPVFNFVVLKGVTS